MAKEKDIYSSEIKVYSCGMCKTFRSCRKAVRKHLRETHGVRGMSMKDGEGSRVSSLTLSEVFE